MKSYNFVLLRAPLQSLNKAFQPIEISSEFDEALFLASIDLWENIKKGDLQKKAKIEESLLKYWLRSCSRSTPFGIFAGTCVLELGGFTDLISESDNHVRNVRFDMNFISAIVTQLEKDPFLRKQLKFKVNQSLYESPNDLRYIEYTINGNERNYKLTSVEKTDYLVKLIKGAQRGVTIEELAQELLKIEDVSYEESIAFIEQLCEDQIFVSDLEISVTGTEPLAQLISKLGQFDDIDNIKMAFSDITNSIESERTGIDYYQKIIQTTKKIITQDIEFKNIFQVDLLLNLKNNTINEKVINEIINQCNELLTFASPYHNENINSFKRLFVEKFEDTEVPLNIALDADLGVGYASVIEKNTGGSKWVDGLAESVNLLSSDITISFFQRFIIDKYTDFLKRNLNEIEITEEDVLKFKPNSSKLCFSNGMYIIGEIQAKLGVFDVENFQFDLVGIGGSSACNLLSRFTHGDKTLHNYTKQIIEGEEKSYPDIIFAEVVHASQVRDTNVLLRPILRMYEIPYVGRSGAEEDFQIPINDLLVSVQNDQVILRSIKFNKRVIPRLTTAHNYYMVNSLSVYSFLGDVQNQGFSNLRPWDWGILSRYKYLPRVVYKNVILKKAQWYLDTDDLKELPTDETEYIAFFNGLRDRQQLPYRILLVEGDNKLLIDLNYLESIKFLLRSIRKFKVIIVEEFLQTEENCILHDGQQNPFVSEIIIPIKNDFQIVKSYNENTAAIKNPKKFLPGSEWVYYKIYAGVKTQEKILTQFILPFIENGEKEKLFEKFFFIRYNDGRPHIRIRFYNSDDEKQQKLQRDFNPIVKDLYENMYTDKLVIDTYIQENNRYKNNLMEISETFFNNDSVTVLKFISLLDDQNSEFYRIIFGMRGIDMFLNDFNFSSLDKHKFFKLQVEAFSKEFSSSSQVRSSLNQKYKMQEKKISLHMDSAFDVQNAIDEPAELLNIRSKLNIKYIGIIMDEFEQNKNDQEFLSFLSSHIHMFINRLFIAKQRKYELLIYSFLERFYSSNLARARTYDS